MPASGQPGTSAGPCAGAAPLGGERQAHAGQQDEGRQRVTGHQLLGAAGGVVAVQRREDVHRHHAHQRHAPCQVDAHDPLAPRPQAGRLAHPVGRGRNDVGAVCVGVLGHGRLPSVEGCPGYAPSAADADVESDSDRAQGQRRSHCPASLGGKVRRFRRKRQRPEDERVIMADMEIDWAHELVEQVDWHWREQLRPRYDGLSDEEYFWEPVANCWNIRPRGQGRAADRGRRRGVRHRLRLPGAVARSRDDHRLAVGTHGRGGARGAGGQPLRRSRRRLPELRLRGHGSSGRFTSSMTSTQPGADGVIGLGEEGLARPCGPAEGPFAALPMAALVLHINREMLHHGAEVALLRDLYANR